MGRWRHHAKHLTSVAEGLPGAGNILAFNNGFRDKRSSAEELVPPLQADGTYGDIPYGPEELEWIYGGDDPEFYSGAMGGVQRLPNGNTLIAEGAYGEISEVTEAGDLVWYYVNPVLEDRALYWNEEIPSNSAGTIQQNEFFLARRYDASYPGLSGRTLTPGDVLELGQSVPEPSGSALLGLAALTLGFFRRRRDFRAKVGADC